MLSTSIALCTYNGEMYLSEQLESLAKQTILPNELVVCDDNSSDNTIAILKDFASKVSFPVLIHKNEKNLGFVRNFEKCAQLCKGDVVFFCDQDDLWQPEKLEHYLQVFQEEPEVGFIFSDAELINEAGETRNVLLSDSLGLKPSYLTKIVKRDCTQFILHYNTWAGMTMAYRNIFQQHLFPYLECAGHDTWTLRILGAITQTRFLKEPLTRYRIHSQNQCGTPVQKMSTVKAAVSFAKNPQLASDHLLLSRDLKNVANRLNQFLGDVRFPQKLPLFLKKSHHHYIRYLIHVHKINKWIAILREMLNGNYFRFGRGFLSAGADIFS